MRRWYICWDDRINIVVKLLELCCRAVLGVGGECLLHLLNWNLSTFGRLYCLHQVPCGHVSKQYRVHKLFHMRSGLLLEHCGRCRIFNMYVVFEWILFKYWVNGVFTLRRWHLPTEQWIIKLSYLSIWHVFNIIGRPELF